MQVFFSISKEESCSYKIECAYEHEEIKSVQQNDINQAVSSVVIKHHIENLAIQEDVRKLKDTIKTMKEKYVHFRKMQKRFR